MQSADRQQTREAPDRVSSLRKDPRVRSQRETGRRSSNKASMGTAPQNTLWEQTYRNGCLSNSLSGKHHRMPQFSKLPEGGVE